MQASREDRVSGDAERGRHSTQTLITAIAVIILAAGAWLLAPGKDDADDAPTPSAQAPLPAPVVAPEPEPVDPVEAAPDIPTVTVDTPEEPAPAEAPPPEPPTPEELDQQLREAMAEVNLPVTGAVQSAVAAPYLLDRGTSAMDQIARGLVPERTLSLPKPSGAFPVAGDERGYRVDTAGYERYNTTVDAIVSLPVATVANLFHRFRPALSESYAALGYPADKLDNTLIAALDGIIAAPIATEAPSLVSKGALWAYKNPEFEQASDLHRQLLRTGPDNTRRLQAWARELRAALLAEP